MEEEKERRKETRGNIRKGETDDREETNEEKE